MNHSEQAKLNSQRRQHPRSDVQMLAYIRMPGGSKHPVRVVDLSRLGFQMECLVYVPTNRPLFLTMPGFAPITCSVAWSHGWHYGCTFEFKLHDAIYEHIVITHPGILRRSAKNEAGADT